ncbi:Alpha/Beta hydrolase protein [Pyronema omphalodes]|nr:Alpha/Beta hydrolase protein [Pyronema omphalodes]
MGRREYYGERFFNKLVYVCHGVGRGLDSMSINRWKAHAVQNNVDVVVHNYPGYGNTTGPPSEESINGDSLHLLKYIVNIRNEEKKLQDGGNVKGEDRAKDVILLGNSIGCGPTMWLAATPETRDLGIDRVLLISPWTSLLYLWPSLLRKFYIDGKDRNKLPENIWGALKPEEVLSDKYLGIWQKTPGCDSFDSLKAVKNLPKTLKGKFMIIHGEDDDTIFPHHSETLAKEMKDIVDPKLYVLKGFDHSHARPWADELIWGFVHDDEKLEDHVKTVTERRGLPPYVYDPRGNIGND